MRLLLPNYIRYTHLCGAAMDLHENATALQEALASHGYYQHHQFTVPDTSTEGFVARRHDEVVLVFRASEDSQDWKNNFQFLKRKNCKLCLPKLWRTRYGLAHAGFVNAYNSAASRINHALSCVRKIDSDLPLRCIGHSLGGALATLAGAEMKAQRVVTFGAPRVFWHTAARRYDHYGPVHARVVNAGDAVCRWPRAYWGMRHVGKEIYFAPDGRYIDDVPARTRLRQSIADGVTELRDAEIFDFEDHAIKLYRQRLVRLYNVDPHK